MARRRSLLFTPGDRPEMLRKAPETGADALVFDLEDAVVPDRKGEAREAVVDVLSDPAFDPDAEVCVRVNAMPEALAADVEALSSGGGTDGGDPVDGEDDGLRLDAVVLPKVGSAADVEDLASRLEAAGLSVPILAMIESAAGVLAASEIATVPETDALVFGAEDLTAEIGATRTPEGEEVDYARQQVVLAAAAAGVDAIDTLVTDFEDERRLRADSEYGSQLGFDGKIAIHPVQVGPINEAFTPDAEEIAWARSVLEGKRQADAEGRGAFAVGGEMIDPPLIARAETILERVPEGDDSAP